MNHAVALMLVTIATVITMVTADIERSIMHNDDNEESDDYDDYQRLVQLIDQVKNESTQQAMKIREFESTIVELTTKNGEFESAIAELTTKNQELVRNNTELESRVNDHDMANELLLEWIDKVEDDQAAKNDEFELNITELARKNEELARKNTELETRINQLKSSSTSKCYAKHVKSGNQTR